MIQQKSAELLFSINVTKQILKILRLIWRLYRLFAALASDKSAVVPYDRDIADNRRKYGDTMLHKAEEHFTNQGQHEVKCLSSI